MQLLSVILATIVLLPVAAPASFLHGTLWDQAARENGLDPVLLYSVTIQESSRQIAPDRVKPWPYALNVNGYGLSLYPQTRKEAESILAYLLSQGIINIDIGLGQVNLKHHGHRVRHWSELLDPKTNLMVAASILREAVDSTADPVLGVGHYHSWTHWRARNYGNKVIALYNRLLEYGRTQLPWLTVSQIQQPNLAAPSLNNLFSSPRQILRVQPALITPTWPEMAYSYHLAPVRRIGGGQQ